MVGLVGDLNQEQKKAVRHERGPLLVVAGPGTGKTTVLTRHLAYLIRQKSLKPEEILALTFTRKAAQEMAERVEELFPEEYVDLPVHTFHGWAQLLLEQHGLEIGLPVPFRLMTEPDLKILMDRHWSRFEFDVYRPRGNNSSLISTLVGHFGHCKDEGIGPDDYLKAYRGAKPDLEERQRRAELAKAYATYQQILLEEGILDFGDLLLYSHELLRKRVRIRRHYQAKIKHLLIDEFQDTNKIQYQLARMLAEPDNNLVVAASADQTIYQWRGAYYGNVDRFLNDHPRAKQVFLKSNYRSAQNLLDLSYDFIGRNDEFDRQGREKGLKARRSRKGRMSVWRFEEAKAERAGIAEEVVGLVEREKVVPGEIAVLLRTNAQVRLFEKTLRQAGLPVRSSSAGDLYRYPVVVDMLAYLSLIVDRYDDTAFWRYLNFPCWSLRQADKDWLIHRSRRSGRPLALVMADPARRRNFTGASNRSADKMLSWLEKPGSFSARTMLDFLEETGYFKKWLGQKPEPEEAEGLRLFLDKMACFQEDHPGADWHYFRERIEAERESGDSEQPDEWTEAVRVMTVHGAKGLEFDHVFLADLTDQTFPTRKQGNPIPWLDEAAEQRDHLREERRLFFVAMTRARRSLYFSWAEDHGGQRRRRPSRFLDEMGLASRAEWREAGAVKPEPRRSKSKLSRPDRFSYTQLTAFRKCPYQYRLAHLDKVSARGGPERSFGTTIHNTLEEFMKKWVCSGGKLKWIDLKKIYRRQWIDEWYRDEKQRQQYWKEGESCLRSFYRRVKEQPPEIYQVRDELWLEKKFRGEIGGFPFRGKIDRVDRIPEGLELIDYKTGRAKEKLSAQDKEQLLIYQLAARDILKIKPVRLSFYYLNEDRKVSFLGSDSDLEKAEDKVRRTIRQILQSDFSAKPGFHCRFCDFGRICPYR